MNPNDVFLDHHRDLEHQPCPKESRAAGMFCPTISSGVETFASAELSKLHSFAEEP